MPKLLQARASTEHLFGAPLVHVRMDAVYEPVKRRGRFSISRGEASSFNHLEAAVKEMQEKMIAGLRLHGFEFVAHPPGGEDPWEFRGPMSHIDFDSSPAATDTVIGRPEIDRVQDPEQWVKWERAEKARAARRLGLAQELVDYELIAMFVRRTRGPMGVLRTAKR